MADYTDYFPSRGTERTITQGGETEVRIGESSSTVVVGEGTSTTNIQGMVSFPNVVAGTIAPAEVIGLNASDQLVTSLLDGGHIADGAISTTKIVDDAVTGAKLAAATFGNGLDFTSNVLTVDPDRGITVGADGVGVRLGQNLSFNASGAIQASSIAVNNTFVGTATSATSEAATLAVFVNAFNQSTASAPGVVDGITVDAGSTIEQGDLVILTHGTSPNEVTETYIYVGDTTAAPGDISASDFSDITHTGDTVVTVTGGAGVATSGSRTAPVVAVDLASNSNLRFVGTGNAGELSLAENISVTDVTASGDLTVSGGVSFDGLTAPTGSTLGTNTALGIDADGDLEVIEIATAANLTGTVNRVVKYQADGTGLDDSHIQSLTNSVSILSGATTFAVDSRTTTINSTEEINIGTAGFQPNDVDVSIRGGSFDVISGDGVDLNAQAGAIRLGSRTAVSGGTTQTGPIELTTRPSRRGTQRAIHLDAGEGVFNVDAVAMNFSFNASAGLGTVPNAIRFNDAPFDLSTGSRNLRFGRSVGRSQTGHIEIITDGELRVEGSGIDSSATDSAPHSLFIGSDGHIFSRIATTAIPTVRTLNAGNAGSTLLTNGNIVVLEPITTSQTFVLPASPRAGTFIDVVNMSVVTATGVGPSPANVFWSFRGAGNEFIMGRRATISSPFQLNDPTASFRLIYSNTQYGWLIVGAN